MINVLTVKTLTIRHRIVILCLMEIDLKRKRPERSKKRKVVTQDNVVLLVRIPRNQKTAIKSEADTLGVTESLYVNAIITARNVNKIKQSFVK